MKDLGKLIYTKSFSRMIFPENDGNGHLNNSYYSNYSEDVRQEFLRSFGWKDGNFGKEKISMLIAKREIKYKKSLKKGDKIKIGLEVFFKKNPFFNMIYTFYNSSEEVVAIDKTTVSFANFRTRKTMNVPNFFLEEIGNC